MKKLTIFGTPINPLASSFEKLAGASFCLSYATCAGRLAEEAIAATGEDGMLLLDNGAWSLFQRGISTLDEDYLTGFAAWARDLLNQSPQAVAVIPDVIDGTEAQNRALAERWIAETPGNLNRWMGMWHLHESLDFLIWLCERCNYVGFGSSGEYVRPGTEKWHGRMQEAFAAIAAWEAEGNVRPRLHLMRAQQFAHLYPFDSSDSTNLAVNHGRQRRRGEPLEAFAARIDGKIQASAGPEAPHQEARPLWEPALRELSDWFHANFEIVPRQGVLPLDRVTA